MSDRPIRREGDQVRDNDGSVYDIEGDHAEASPDAPRDVPGMAPAAGYAGGAGGIVTSVGHTAADDAGSELRSTSESGPHGAVAEAADLGQRPLRDYKRDADPAMDATDTTMSAGQSSTGPVDSYVSDADAVGGTAVGSAGVAATSSGGTVRGGGRTILDTSRDRIDAATSGTREDAITDRDRTGIVRETVVRDEPITTSSQGVTSSDVGRGTINASTDNTGDIVDTGGETLTNVQVGYRVVDGNGDEIGKVTDLKSGDSDAITGDDASGSFGGGGAMPIAVPGGTGTGGSTGSGSGVGVPAVVAAGGDWGGEPNVQEPAYSRLSRLGFIKIDAKGWFNSDLYAGADQIARVEGETVYLRGGKDDLISER